MGAVQMMCARIGMVTGRGLAAGLHARFPRWLVVPAITALLVVNTITVGADLSAMADAVEMLTGLNSHYFVVVFGGALIYGTLRFRYRQLADILKWLAASLIAYMSRRSSSDRIGKLWRTTHLCRSGRRTIRVGRFSSRSSARPSVLTSSSGRRRRTWKKTRQPGGGCVFSSRHVRRLRSPSARWTSAPAHFFPTS